VRCSACGRRRIGEVWATRDGGRSWVRVLRTGSGIREVTVVGSGTAFVLGGKVGDLLYRTSDRGRDWTLLGKSHLGQLTFLTPETGWATRTWDYPEGLVVTTDGGRSWQAGTDPCRPEQSFDTGVAGWGPLTLPYVAGVSFISVDHGWVLCAGDGAGGSAPIGVFETFDDGQTWTRRYTSIYPEPGGFRFAADGRGWLWQQGIGWIDGSADGGKTWRHVGSFGNGVMVSELSFTVGGIGIAIGDRALWRSPDGGRTWHIVNRDLGSLGSSAH
jgi:photosystem II stability/assembly factor-like uncharacterized protein